ncbi:TA system VapC family ribonuclease toxin [Acidicapsa acidisoli]|uniref:TA system VapC family ribonuclease toxin n=1 Tax=Acidicapsa acidisoli TaxID=1615681 RepID=UPI0021DF6832|nr:TA system VapC family ribonuclease toxin [Acidicapsa acidisoli]
MTPFLLDINVLLGIAWQDQQSHTTVFPWFKSTGRQNFATCAISQSGFVRISSSVQFRPNPVSIKEAFQALTTLIEMPGHTFWPIDIGILEATASFADKLFGPLQLTDAYLLGLAITNGGTLVTRDRAIPQLAGKAFAKHVLLLK